MSLYVCDKCGTVENTAFGNYWIHRFNEETYPDALCSLCSPPKYEDGSNNPSGGGWHDNFPRTFPDRAEILRIGTSQFMTTRKFREILATK